MQKLVVALRGGVIVHDVEIRLRVVFVHHVVPVHRIYAPHHASVEYRQFPIFTVVYLSRSGNYHSQPHRPLGIRPPCVPVFLFLGRFAGFFFYFFLSLFDIFVVRRYRVDGSQNPVNAVGRECCYGGRVVSDAVMCGCVHAADRQYQCGHNYTQCGYDVASFHFPPLVFIRCSRCRERSLSVRVLPRWRTICLSSLFPWASMSF